VDCKVRPSPSYATWFYSMPNPCFERRDRSVENRKADHAS
jgi:hypothetical protein